MDSGIGQFAQVVDDEVWRHGRSLSGAVVDPDGAHSKVLRRGHVSPGIVTDIDDAIARRVELSQGVFEQTVTWLDATMV